MIPELNDDGLFLRNGWPMKGCYTLFPAESIVRDFYYGKSLTRHEQGLNLRRIRLFRMNEVQTLINKDVQ